MASNHSVQLRVDRLSTLPPELLTLIFDLSHDPAQPLREPLSRTLLPYFRRNFYRQVRLSSSSSSRAIKLLRTLREDPSIGSLVRSLNVIGGGQDAGFCKILKKLLEYVPFLDWLRTSQVSELFADFDRAHLPRLETLSYTCHKLSHADLNAIARFTTVKSLRIVFQYVGIEGPETCSKVLSNLNKLTLEHSFKLGLIPEFWDVGMARFVNRLSQLTNLDLCEWDLPKYSDFLEGLTHAPSSLKSLGLLTFEELDGVYELPCDHLLPRFVNLERLDLTDGTVTTALPSFLRQLPLLSYLRLGIDTWRQGPTPEALLSLLEGPTRLSSLRSLVLDTFEGWVGRRVDLGQTVNVDFNLESDSWNIPTFEEAEAEGAGWDFVHIRRLKEAGDASGVDVTGDTFNAMNVMESAKLEKGNRLILEAYQQKSLVKYILYSNDRHFRLPVLRIGTLDSQNLKLVKTHLPELGWHQFTFE